MKERLNQFIARLKTMLRRRQLNQDLKDELAFHMEMREQALREHGAADARLQARRQFGNARVRAMP